jgi:trehalose 6-phosphate phosphatase
MDLLRAVAAFAAQPKVLVAVDFDGTLSPFVLDPMQARAVPGGVEVLRAAAGLAGVTVAVVSGRDLATLEMITGIGPGDAITLIGSHGAQLSLNDHAVLDKDAAASLSVLSDELEAIRARYPEVRLEHKPTAVVLHTRGVDPSVAAGATSAAVEVAQRHPGVHVMPGKNVVELTVLEANKGHALVELARATGSDATLYAGDDVTDERAFAALDPASGDLTVKVGEGETIASQRVPDQGAVVELLERFVDLRRPGRQARS